MIIIDKNAKREVQVKYPDRTRVLFPNLDDGYISSNDIVVPGINAPISDDGVAVASINDGAEGGAISKLVIGIEPVQDLHGQSNPYPAGGGKNLIGSSVLSTKTNGNVTFTPQTTVPVVSLSGTSNDNFPYYICPNGTDVIKSNAGFVLPAGTYTFSATKSDGTKLNLGGTIGIFYWEGSSDTRQIVQANNSNVTSVSVTSAETLYMTPTFSGVSGKATGFDVYLQLESGSSATAWSPYSNICPINGWTQAKIYVQDEYDATADPTAIINLNGTRYGGTLDVTTGVLTVDRGLKKASEISNWILGNALNDETGFVCYAVNTFATNNPNAISNAYKEHVVNAWENLTFGEYMSSTSLIVTVPTEKNTTALAKAYLNELDASFVYELAEPLTIQLTPQEVTTLLGQNNIWADCGDVLELSYSANMNIRLQDLLDEKLDKPTTPGTLGQVLTSDGEGGQTWETPE